MRPGTTPRPTIAMVREAAVTPAWVIAGVYGWLAREALPRATALIWRNIELEECVANVTRRGLRRAGMRFRSSRCWRRSGSIGFHDNAHSFKGQIRILPRSP